MRFITIIKKQSYVKTSLSYRHNAFVQAFVRLCRNMCQTNEKLDQVMNTSIIIISSMLLCISGRGFVYWKYPCKATSRSRLHYLFKILHSFGLYYRSFESIKCLNVFSSCH